jgi:hypothetical protein
MPDLMSESSSHLSRRSVDFASEHTVHVFIVFVARSVYGRETNKARGYVVDHKNIEGIIINCPIVR